jgi:DNA-directed RNA polymerase subunit beta'
MMADSGARGSRQQIRQLAGMRGLMQKAPEENHGGGGRNYRVAHYFQFP